MLLFDSLLPSSLHIIRRAVSCGGLVIDPLDKSYADDKLAVIELMLKMVVKDTATDVIKRPANHDKSACKCIRSNGEDTSSYIERFFLPAQAYLNLAGQDMSSISSQNLAMTMLASAKLPHDTFFTIMTYLVSTVR